MTTLVLLHAHPAMGPSVRRHRITACRASAQQMSMLSRSPLSRILPPPRLLVLAASAAGWALAVSACVILLRAGGAGVDFYAYWLAGQHFLDGQPLYGAVSLHEVGAYLYPPLFAQLMAPVSLLPLPVADWGWRIIGVLSIRYLAGSWRTTGIWFLLPWTLTELGAGGVTLPLSALVVASLRGHAAGIGTAVAVKYGAALVVPYLWLRRPGTRRDLIAGAAAIAGVCALSALLAPGAWLDWLAALRSQAGQPFDNPQLLHLLPTAGADYAVRLVIAVIMLAGAIRRDPPALAYLAVFLATPTLWVQRACVLMALPTLDAASPARSDSRVRVGASGGRAEVPAGLDVPVARSQNRLRRHLIEDQ